jgi:hydrogenase maturation protein HypF
VEQVSDSIQARQISVRGMVQGVGFRPFVYLLARRHNLYGYVLNTSDDVSILVEGLNKEIEVFLKELRDKAPPQARIESISMAMQSPSGYKKFEIKPSIVKENGYQLISPDIATCSACKAEIFEPANRRYRYPFTNCTNCGPRFTIIENMPYDRLGTTMSKFKMCPDCQREYDNPKNRRFHAQPNACPKCGPRLELTDKDGKPIFCEDVIVKSGQLLKQGKILAIKGLGGFLLACDARNGDSVTQLRKRKNRPAKPFAVMVNNLEQAVEYCSVSSKEAESLLSPAAPIVLLKLKMPALLAPEVTPGLKHLGVMLPYTPLHHLLLAEIGFPLIMTSGNLSEEPIACDNREALHSLGSIADYFILHNRDIYSRYDDSVVMIEQDYPSVVRRARGYAPYPIHLPFSSRPVLACGAELKNTFCLAQGNHAFVSQHIGDMENEDTLEHFEHTLCNYEKLFHIQPEIVACDMHPDYLPTKWAQAEAKNTNIQFFPVQHHYAHILSCMAENGIQNPVIGVALDGTGYGLDGNIWGSEFMIAGYQGFQRKAHLEYLPLPGGTAAINRPYRTAAGYLYSLFGAEILDSNLSFLKDIDPMEIDLIRKQVDHNLNTPLTSSCGRLFDAVSALSGVKQQVSYEGQAAMELEAIADEGILEKLYPYNIEEKEGIRIIRVRDLFSALILDLKLGVPATKISRIFHNTMSRIVGELVFQLSRETSIKQVALSGGVFQNRLLLNLLTRELRDMDLVPLVQRKAPCNDGGISLGQAVAANFNEGKI